MSGAGTAPAPLLEIDGLEIGFRGEGGITPVVEGMSLAVAAGGTLGLVGESGCGKSLTARAVMRLLPEPPAVVRARGLRLAGRELLGLSGRAMRQVPAKS